MFRRFSANGISDWIDIRFLSLRTKVVAVKTLAAALPSRSLGQRSPARGTGQVMHFALRDFDESANARSAEAIL